MSGVSWEADPSGGIHLSPGVSLARRYNTAEDKTTEEIQLRIMRALFSDDIPAPRDIVIVSLASASGVFESMLSPDELTQVRERIDTISRLDRIGREIAATIQQIKAQPPPPSFRPTAEIPEAAGLPLLGNAFGMAGDLRGFLLREYQRHGPIFRVRALQYRWVALVGPPKRTSSLIRIQPLISVLGSSITNLALHWAPIASFCQ